MTTVSRAAATARRKKLEQGTLLASVELFEGGDDVVLPSVIVQYWRSQEGEIRAQSGIVEQKMWTMQMRLPLYKRGRPSADAIRDSLVQLEAALQDRLGRQEPAS